MTRIRHPEDLGRDLFEYAASAVPIGASVGGSIKDFDELGVIRTRPEQVFSGFEVGGESVSGELKMTMNAISQFGNELVGVSRTALSVW